MDFIRLLQKNEILRRYIVMNSFDGALTILGIVIAMMVANVSSVRLVLISAIGVIFATGVSGVWGGYLAEKAERKHQLTELKKLHPNEDLSKRRKKFKKLTIIMGLANGLSSSIVGVITIAPFFFAGFGLISVNTAYLTSIMLVGFALVIIGSFTARIARENIAKHAFMMVLAGIIVGLVIYLFELLKFG